MKKSGFKEKLEMLRGKKCRETNVDENNLNLSLQACFDQLNQLMKECESKNTQLSQISEKSARLLPSLNSESQDYIRDIVSSQQDKFQVRIILFRTNSATIKFTCSSEFA